VVEIGLTKIADRAGDLDRVLVLLRDLASAEPILDHDAHAIRLPVEGGASILAEAVRRLDGAGLVVSELSLHRPTLDDVFLTLTGHHAEGGAPDDDSGGGNGSGPGGPVGPAGRPAERRTPRAGGTPT